MYIDLPRSKSLDDSNGSGSRTVPGTGNNLSESPAYIPSTFIPSTPVQNNLLEILQREQCHAMSLLESSPFLSSLLLSYAQLARGHDCGGSPVATLVAGTRASGPVSSTSPNSYITELALLQAEINNLRNELTQAQESAALEIQRAKHDAQRHLVEQARVNTELDSTKTTYAQLKEDHEQTLHAQEALVSAFAKLQVEHAQAVSDKKEYCMEIEKLQEVQAEWQTAQYDALNQSHIDLATESDDFKRETEKVLENMVQAAPPPNTAASTVVVCNERYKTMKCTKKNCRNMGQELEAARAVAVDWKSKHNTLIEKYAEIRDLHKDCKEPYCFEELQNDLKDEKEKYENAIRSLAELHEQNEALHGSYIEVQESHKAYVATTERETCTLRSERDRALEEKARIAKRHGEDISIFQSDLTEAVRLYNEQSANFPMLVSGKVERALETQNIQHRRQLEELKVELQSVKVTFEGLERRNRILAEEAAKTRRG